jgi:hypothetical protein
MAEEAVAMSDKALNFPALVWVEKMPDKRYEADSGDVQPYVIMITPRGRWNIRQGMQHIATVRTVEQAKAKTEAYRIEQRQKREAYARLLGKETP